MKLEFLSTEEINKLLKIVLHILNIKLIFYGH